MDVVSTCPLRVASRVWPADHGGAALTVVCKAVYLLAPGESPLHPHQEAPNEEDAYWDDDPRRSLSSASDLVPFKPRPDVVLVGSAFAPGRRPARSIVARVILAEVDKAIEACCDRAFRQTGELIEGVRVAQMPLRYERAAGGPGTWNPVGVRHDAGPDGYGMVALPNLQPPGVHVATRETFIEPAGFGPIAPSWPTRAQKIGPNAAGWAPERWHERPLPLGLDPSFFNVAPADQQVSELRSNERIVLENLLRDHPRLVTSLPGIRPAAVVERAGGKRERLAMTADTLTIDTGLGTCSMVWRAWVRIHHPEEAGRVVISLETSATASDRAESDANLVTAPAPLRVAAAPATPFTSPIEDPKTPMLGSTMRLHGASSVPPLSGSARSPRSRAGGTWTAAQHAGSAPPIPFGREVPVDTKSTMPETPYAGRGPATPFLSPSAAGPSALPPPSPPQRRSDGDTLNDALVPAREALPFRADPAQDVEEPTVRTRVPPHVALGHEQPVAFPPQPAPLLVGPPAKTEAPAEEERFAASDEEGEAPAPPEPAPGDFPIARCGALTARIAMDRPATAELLETEGLTPARWEAVAGHWEDAIREERARGRNGLQKAFDAGYVEGVEARRGPITVAEYARLVVGAERGSAAVVAYDLGLPRGAPMRVERVWAARMVKEPAFGRQVREAIAAERAG